MLVNNESTNNRRSGSEEGQVQRGLRGTPPLPPPSGRGSGAGLGSPWWWNRGWVGARENGMCPYFPYFPIFWLPSPVPALGFDVGSLSQRDFAPNLGGTRKEVVWVN